MKANYIIWLFVLFLLSACRLPGPELTPEEEDVVDTLYNRRLPLLRAQLDSICDFQHDSLRQQAVDSLVELQLVEIKKLISRE